MQCKCRVRLYKSMHAFTGMRHQLLSSVTSAYVSMDSYVCINQLDSTGQWAFFLKLTLSHEWHWREKQPCCACAARNNFAEHVHRCTIVKAMWQQEQMVALVASNANEHPSLDNNPSGYAFKGNDMIDSHAVERLRILTKASRMWLALQTQRHDLRHMSSQQQELPMLR